MERAAKGAVAEQILASEFEAVRRFYALWTAQKQLLVLEATAARSKEFSDRAQALFEAGRGNKGDALAAQVNLGNDRISAEKQRAVCPRRRSISPPGSAARRSTTWMRWTRRCPRLRPRRA